MDTIYHVSATTTVGSMVDPEVILGIWQLTRGRLQRGPATAPVLKFVGQSPHSWTLLHTGSMTANFASNFVNERCEYAKKSHTAGG